MNILFVEDDEAIIMGLTYIFQKEAYNVTVCKTRREAIQAYETQTFDLLLLDVTLPDGTGYDICQLAKQRGDVAVIFLTAMDDEANIVKGLDMGGDDYICKPFRVHELMSRIQSVMRRYHRDTNVNDIYLAPHIRVNVQEASVWKYDQPCILTALEYRLLLMFIQHRNQILTRRQLLESVFDIGCDFVNDNTLSVYIRRLREKIEDDPADPVCIKTIRGMGYRLDLL